MIEISSDNFRPFFDHAALIRDLESVRPEEPAGVVDLPLSALAAVGADLLHATPGDLGAMRIRWESDVTFHLGEIIAAYAFSGSVPVSAMIVATVAGRRDLYPSFSIRDQLSLEKALRWFVLHGVCEHRLWHLLNTRFVTSITRPADELVRGSPSPLGLLVLGERPDLHSRFHVQGRWSQDAFDEWLGTDGVADYNLFWCLKDPGISRYAASLSPAATVQNAAVADAATASAFAPDRFRSCEVARQQLQSALAWLADRTAFWAARGRLYSVAEFDRSTPSTQLLLDGVVSRAGRWPETYSHHVAVALPTRLRQRSYVLLEAIVHDHDDTIDVSCAIDGDATPCRVLRNGRSLCVLAFVGNGGTGSPCQVMRLEFSSPQHPQPPRLELVRAWNF